MDMDAVHFFAKAPEAKPLYEAVEKKVLNSFDDVKIKVQKSQISFSHGKSFAYVWLPIRKMKNRPEVYIILTFGLDYRIHSSRIVESKEPYHHRWTHHVIIQDPSEMDDELMGWLRQAYVFEQR